MTFGEMIEQMHVRLTSFGSGPKESRVVKMGVHSNYGYMSETEVQKAVEFLSQRALVASMTGEKLNPLEALGVKLLIESAHLYDDIAETVA